MRTKDFDINKLRDNWEYKEDRNGEWKVLTPDRVGRYRGDCEDFALTALFLICGGSWKKFWKELIFGDAKIQRVKSPSGDTHAILEFNGVFIDNWAKQWQTKRELKDLGYEFYTNKHYWFTAVHKLYPKESVVALLALVGGVAYAVSQSWIPWV